MLTFLFVFFQGDDAAAVQNMAESPVDTDPADATEVRLRKQLLDMKPTANSTKLHFKVREGTV